MRTYFNYRPTKEIIIYTREEVERILTDLQTTPVHPVEFAEVEWRDDGTVKVTTQLKPVLGCASKIGTLEDMSLQIK